MPTVIIGARQLYRWVAVMILAIGVVIMHHVVGTHTHHSSSGHGSSVMAMPASQTPGVSPAAAGAVATPPAQPGPDGGLLHPCLAVLSGLVLLAAVILTRRLTHAPDRGPSGSGLGRRASRQRAPPVPLRLADLGVLRL